MKLNISSFNVPLLYVCVKKEKETKLELVCSYSHNQKKDVSFLVKDENGSVDEESLTAAIKKAFKGLKGDSSAKFHAFYSIDEVLSASEAKLSDKSYVDLLTSKLTEKGSWREQLLGVPMQGFFETSFVVLASDEPNLTAGEVTEIKKRIASHLLVLRTGVPSSIKLHFDNALTAEIKKNLELNDSFDLCQGFKANGVEYKDIFSFLVDDKVDNVYIYRRGRWFISFGAKGSLSTATGLSGTGYLSLGVIRDFLLDNKVNGRDVHITLLDATSPEAASAETSKDALSNEKKEEDDDSEAGSIQFKGVPITAILDLENDASIGGYRSEPQVVSNETAESIKQLLSQRHFSVDVSSRSFTKNKALRVPIRWQNKTIDGLINKSTKEGEINSEGERSWVRQTCFYSIENGPFDGRVVLPESFGDDLLTSTQVDNLPTTAESESNSSLNQIGSVGSDTGNRIQISGSNSQSVFVAILSRYILKSAVVACLTISDDETRQKYVQRAIKDYAKCIAFLASRHDKRTLVTLFKVPAQCSLGSLLKGTRALFETVSSWKGKNGEDLNQSSVFQVLGNFLLTHYGERVTEFSCLGSHTIYAWPKINDGYVDEVLAGVTRRAVLDLTEFKIRPAVYTEVVTGGFADYLANIVTAQTVNNMFAE